MKTFVLAGHETSASMLNWTLYELTQNSDIMAKVKYLEIFVASNFLYDSFNIFLHGFIVL